jgi:hypothetical protein
MVETPDAPEVGNDTPSEQSGELSPEQGLADVFRDIGKKKIKGDILLHVSSPNGFTSGDLLITNSRSITGASCEQNEIIGYDAACKLLLLSHGRYSWRRVAANETVHIVRNLEMDLKNIIPQLPLIPDDQFDLGEKATPQAKVPIFAGLLKTLNPSRLFALLVKDKPSQPETVSTGKRLKRTTSMTLTALKPIVPQNAESYPVLEVQHLFQEKLRKGSSIAHTINRTFSNPASDSKQRERHRWSFRTSRSSNSLVPVYVMVAIVSFLTFAGLLWFSKSHPSSRASAPKSATAINKDSTHRHPSKRQRSHQ